MNKLVIVISFVIVTFVIGSLSPAWAVGQAGYDIATLKAGVGARPLGMGGAFTAIADNADAPYWNPAGLGFVRDQEINTMQTRLSTDADHYYISYVKPMGKGTLGVSWIQVGIGAITQTTATVDAWNEVQNLNTFSYFSNAFLFSYGLPLNPNISVGMTAKYLTSDMFQIQGGQAYGYSLTPAVLIELRNKLRIGLKIDEIINEQSWGTGTVEKVPAKARLGVAYTEPRGLLAGSTFALDLGQTMDSTYSTELSAGYEWAKDGLALRAGYSDAALTGGVGFRSGVAQIDYAYVQQSSLSRENVHRISLAGKW